MRHLPAKPSCIGGGTPGHLFLLLPLLAAGSVCWPAPAANQPPEIENVRYTEDYGYLATCEPSARAALAPWAPLKYIALNERGDIYLTVGTELRLRYELYRKNNWGEGPQDSDGYLWARALPLVDLHAGEHFRAFGQLISAVPYDLDVRRSPVDEDRIDILQGFADWRFALSSDGSSTITLRPGRQLLTYGSGRLIDIRYGPNVLQSFDALKAFAETDRWRIDAFYARPVVSRAGAFDDRTDENRSVWSLYTTLHTDSSPFGLDLYYIGYENNEATFATASGRELRHTVGTRLFGKARGWDWNYEAFYQFGNFDTPPADGSIRAWSVASDTGYNFAQAPLRPRLALKANIISGDRDPNSVNVETFNPLFPKGKYFGELSPIGPANLIHINPYSTLRLSEALQITGNVAFYWRESDQDGIYALGGTRLLRASNGSKARFIGTQLELLLDYQMSRHLSASASFSVFSAGSFLRETGPHETINFFSLELLYRF